MTVDAADPGSLVVFGTLTTWLALGFLTAALVFRWFATGHGPFANMYEFSIAFAWGALAVHVYFLRPLPPVDHRRRRAAGRAGAAPLRHDDPEHGRRRSSRRFRTTCC